MSSCGQMCVRPYQLKNVATKLSNVIVLWNCMGDGNSSSTCLPWLAAPELWGSLCVPRRNRGQWDWIDTCSPVWLWLHLPGELGHKWQAYSCMCTVDHVMTTFELRRESEVLVSWEQSSSYFTGQCTYTVTQQSWAGGWDLGEPVCVSSKARRRLGDITGKSQHNH